MWLFVLLLDFFLISSEIFTICKQNLILIFFAKLSVQLVPPIMIITAVVILHKSFKALLLSKRYLRWLGCC